MTPAELNTYCRQRYNATADTFYSDPEMYTYMYDAAMSLARETFCIRNVYTTSTVIDQREYSKPSRSIALKRVTYEGAKLTKISDRDDDTLTANNEETTQTGTPIAYWEWSSVIDLRPIPVAVGTLKIYSYDQPDVVTVSSTFDVPSRYHMDMSNYVLWMMAMKDKNTTVAGMYKDVWADNKKEIKRQEMKILRRDSFSAVIDDIYQPVATVGTF